MKYVSKGRQNLLIKVILILFWTCQLFAIQCPSTPKIANSIEFAEITKVQSLADFFKMNDQKNLGTNEAFLLHFSNSKKGIFKPDTRNLWSVNGEVGAFTFSEFLEADVIPPTFKRHVGQHFGSLQEYVENDYRPELLSSKEKFKKLNSYSKKIVSDFIVIHFMTGQWDRHWGNVILLEDRLKAIDNEVTSDHSIGIFGDYPFLRRGTDPTKAESYDFEDLLSFPFQQVVVVENLSLNRLQAHFKDFMSQEKIEKYFKKYQRKNLNSIKYVVWKGYLWIQVPPKAMGPAQVISPQRALSSLMKSAC